MSDTKLSYEEAIQKLDAMTDQERSQFTPTTTAIVEALIKKHAKDETYDNWTDLMEMIGDIKQHAIDHNSAIVPCDDPIHLRLGFICSETKKQWYIKIADYKRSLTTMDEDKAGLFKKSVLTQEGKLALCQAMSATGIFD